MAKNEKPLSSMPVHVCPETGGGYIQWSDIQFTFVGIDHLEYQNKVMVLFMIDSEGDLGHSDERFEVPSLRTNAAMWSSDSAITTGRRIAGSVLDLVTQAIGYIEKVPRTKWQDPVLTRSQSAAIKSYLDDQGCDNMEGNLHRYINDDRLVTWKCPEHLHRLHGPMNVGAIRNFVSDRGGLVDLQQATIKVDLTSKVEADQFVSLVTSFQHIFDLSIKLNWEVTRSQVVELCVEVTRTRAVVLVIDGIALGIHPQDRVLWMEDFVVQIMEDFDVGYNAPRLGLQLISLLNYPQPQEQFIYTGDCSFHHKMISERPTYDWVDLQRVLRKFRKSVLEARTVSDSVVVAEELKLAMTKYGLAEVRLINVHNGLWHGVFDLETVALIDVTSSDMTRLRSVVSLGNLCRLTLDLVDPNLDHELYCMIEANPGLQELNISDKECNLLGRIEHILAVRHSSLDPIRITLLERGKETQ
ncbi:hypothetical protein BG005_008379, partial [Podila minutissima]